MYVIGLKGKISFSTKKCNHNIIRIVYGYIRRKYFSLEFKNIIILVEKKLTVNLMETGFQWKRAVLPARNLDCSLGLSAARNRECDKE